MTNPVAVDFLKSLTYKFGLDPKQQIDMNDPMTRLVMAISIATTEQGENIYSYDQYIKGCAESAGIDPAVFDSEVNPTSLGIENNNPSTGTNASSAGGSAGGGGGNTSGYVSPKLPKIVAGGSSLPTTLISQYAAAGTAAILENPAFQNVFGGIPISKISTSSVLDSLGFQNAAASVRAAEAAASGTVLAAGGVITAASAGVPVSFGTTAPTINPAVVIPGIQQAAGPNAGILTVLATQESSGNPNIVNKDAWKYGAVQSIDMSSGSLTAGQVIDAQMGILRTGAPSSAAGLFQITGTNMKDLVANNPYGITRDTPMTVEVQTQLANTLALRYNNGQPVTDAAGAYAVGTGWAGRGNADSGAYGARTSANYGALGSSTPGPVADPGRIGLPTGETYTNQGVTTATTTDEAYTTYSDSKGNEFYRYNDGSVYKSTAQDIQANGENAQATLVKPPTGVPANFTTPTLNADGSYSYTDPANPDVKYTQSADLKKITDPMGNAVAPTPSPSDSSTVTPTPGTRSAAIETTPLAVPGTNVSAQQLEIQNSINRDTNAYGNLQNSIRENSTQITEIRNEFANSQADLANYQGSRDTPEYQMLEARAQAAATAVDTKIPGLETINADLQAQSTAIETRVNDTNQEYQQLPSPGDTTTIPGIPTPDTGVVNSSNITPGSQAQTNAANAAAGGMGAPGC